MSLAYKNGLALTGLSAIDGVTSISAYNGISATLGGGGGGWNPNLYGTPQVWLYGGSLSVSNGDPVTTWTDSSGSGNNATVSGTMVTSGINSLKTVDVTGAGVAFGAYQATGDYTCFTVCDTMLDSSGAGITTLYRAAGQADVAGRYTSNSYLRVLINPVSWGDGTTAFPATKCVLTMRRTGSLCELFLNGTLVSSNTVSTTNVSGPYAVNNARLAEFVLYPAALTGGNKTGPETALTTKYSIP